VRSLPKHPEAERAILQAVYLGGSQTPGEMLALVEAARLEAGDFAVEAHADVFRGIMTMLQRGDAVDLFPLMGALDHRESVQREGGRPWLSNLLVSPTGPETGSFAGNAKLVHETGVRRRAALSVRATLERMLDPELSVEEAIQAGAEAFNSSTTRLRPLENNVASVNQVVEDIHASAAGRRPGVIATGIAELDEEVGGLVPGILTLVGAYPGVGKSALLATIALNLASRGVRVGFFSLEDDRRWLTNRWLSLATGIALFRIVTAPLGKDEVARVDKVSATIAEHMRNVFVEDKQSMTAAEVVQTAREMVVEHHARALVLDHLGEIRLSRTDRYDLDIADALASLREIAKRHHVPILVASHVKRRPNCSIAEPPSLMDFANSAACERMARVALGLSKPNAYTLRVTVFKQTNGRSNFNVDLPMLQHAAMVDPGPRLRVVGNE
jgi:replicative DNA helicase